MNIKHYVLIGFSLFTLVSCSEESDAVEEYPNWKNHNEQFFEETFLSEDYDMALKKYSLADGFTASHTDYILVDVLEEGLTTFGTPYLNDTVQIHYVGHLLPSTTYKTGYQFDASYLEPFDFDTAVPTKFVPNGLIPGFTTALLNMHKGDHWMVMVPYQLGYGTTENGSIPAYSTLVFEIRLEDFWTKTKGDRY